MQMGEQASAARFLRQACKGAKDARLTTILGLVCYFCTLNS